MAPWVFVQGTSGVQLVESKILETVEDRAVWNMQNWKEKKLGPVFKGRREAAFWEGELHFGGSVTKISWIVGSKNYHSAWGCGNCQQEIDSAHQASSANSEPVHPNAGAKDEGSSGIPIHARYAESTRMFWTWESVELVAFLALAGFLSFFFKSIFFLLSRLRLYAS